MCLQLSNGGLEASPLLNASHLFFCEQTTSLLQELAYESQVCVSSVALFFSKIWLFRMAAVFQWSVG
jgi:hypothetical protein